MKLIVTGGGTGGHIYPALEIAKHARAHGDEVSYFGSVRGQEGKASERENFPFQGFPSQPLYSLRSLRGLKSAMALLKARGLARAALKLANPDAVFSTGGYSAGPVVSGARSLGIPYLIHEANSVPGRSNLIFAKEARAFTTLFKSTERFAPEVRCQRVGQPVRSELRSAVGKRSPEPDLVLCIGGSQGSEFLNGCVPRAFAGSQLLAVRLLIASGPKNFETTQKVVTGLGIGDRVTVWPYLETDEMLDAYCRATVVIGRSGGTLAELAMFGIPSVLVPLPTSAGDHQLHNAEEFVDMNASILLNQADATPSAVSDAVAGWLGDAGRLESAQIALHAWDLPDATETIYGLLSRTK
ncbi:MAG: UDP-N-acetylglucosamine--N-acetylmuramyl-(pentapeptide) pyrophosphoryl-undecaprenol N-acetylglucosamine transferase [Chlorobia bacterium]|nr:UDP-N-acetylglucosamine--N-acetylmuramyl-(pentapeptide) pyrophosphoryl-undecaprenol N-acetylglucosamine transferase [Fimbriimonadaceae bacterium]